MKKVLIAVAAIALSTSEFASAATPFCEAQVADKKLSFAARARLINDCQKHAVAVATTACHGEADGKQITGAAKTKFVKACVKDATRTKRPVNSIVPSLG